MQIVPIFKRQTSSTRSRGMNGPSRCKPNTGGPVMNKGKTYPLFAFHSRLSPIPHSNQANPKIDSAKVLWVGMLRPVQPRSSPLLLSRSNFPRKARKIPEEVCPSPHHEIQCYQFFAQERGRLAKIENISSTIRYVLCPPSIVLLSINLERGRKRRFRGSRALNCACCDQSVFAYPFPVGRRGMGEEKWRGGCCLTTFYSWLSL